MRSSARVLVSHTSSEYGRPVSSALCLIIQLFYQSRVRDTLHGSIFTYNRDEQTLLLLAAVINKLTKKHISF